MNGHKNRSKKEEHPLYELVFTFRGNSIDAKDGITSLLAKAINEFMQGHKIGTYCNDSNSANYDFHLTTYKERKENKNRKWICDLPEAK